MNPRRKICNAQDFPTDTHGHPRDKRDHTGTRDNLIISTVFRGLARESSRIPTAFRSFSGGTPHGHPLVFRRHTHVKTRSLLRSTQQLPTYHLRRKSKPCLTIRTAEGIALACATDRLNSSRVLTSPASPTSFFL